MKADLHIHSTSSDGRLYPWDIVWRAAQAEVPIISITDHDSVGGVAIAVEETETFPWMLVIPGVELATDIPQGELHILGYFIDYTHPKLLEFLRIQRNSREDRALSMLEKLSALGVHIKFRRVRELAAGESLGRPHIARAMVEAGYVPSMRDAFTKYIAWGCPAYVPRDKVSPREILSLVQEVGGITVMAHPLELKVGEAELEGLIVQLKTWGLAGIEAYYDDYPPYQKKHLAELAHKHGLVATGGSDYHGIYIDDTSIGAIEIPDEDIDRFLEIGRRQVYAPR